MAQITEWWTTRSIAASVVMGFLKIRSHSEKTRFVVSTTPFPERGTRRAGRSKLESFIPYLEQQLAAGQDNAMQLWRNPRDEHRYTGSRALISR